MNEFSGRMIFTFNTSLLKFIVQRKFIQAKALSSAIILYNFIQILNHILLKAPNPFEKSSHQSEMSSKTVPLAPHAKRVLLFNRTRFFYLYRSDGQDEAELVLMQTPQSVCTRALDWQRKVTNLILLFSHKGYIIMPFHSLSILTDIKAVN